MISGQVYTPDCFNKFGANDGKCVACMCDVSCEQATLRGGKTTLPYSRAEAAKRLVLSGTFGTSRFINDLVTAFEMKPVRATTYIRSAIKEIKGVFPFYLKESRKIFTAQGNKSFIRGVKSLLLDKRQKNFFLDATAEVEEIFEINAEHIERRRDLIRPVSCETVVTMVERAYEYAKMSRVRRVISFGRIGEKPPNDFWELLKKGSLRIWSVPFSMLYVALWYK